MTSVNIQFSVKGLTVNILVLKAVRALLQLLSTACGCQAARENVFKWAAPIKLYLQKQVANDIRPLTEVCRPLDL